MRDFAFALRHEALPDGDLVFQFNVEDGDSVFKRFVVIRDSHTQICDENIGNDVDIYLTASMETFGKIWFGELGPLQARENNLLKVVGLQYLDRNLSKWLGVSQFSNCNPRREGFC